MSDLKILFVGQTVPGSRTLQRIKALKNIGCRVEVISTNLAGARYEDRSSLATRIRHRLRCPADVADANGKIVERAAGEEFDLLWLERAIEIKAATLRQVEQRQPRVIVLWYAEDDMMNPRHLSRYVEAALPKFDLWVTTKSFNADSNEMPLRGVRNILFVNNSYDPAVHHPASLVDTDHAEYGADVSFVGTFENVRAESVKFLAKNGINVRVWGNGWANLKGQFEALRIEDRPVYDDQYGKVVCGSKINLCFLRKGNRDLQTCRSIEIPAFGGFMLHERNDEICNLFEEDIEAAYFADDKELLGQCRKWLSEDIARTHIAKAGHNNVVSGNFSHQDRLREILSAAEKVKS